MTIRPDTTVLKDWLDADQLDAAAGSMRSDGAAYRDLTDGVAPVWRDLKPNFRLFSVEADPIERAGVKVSDYGKAVGAAADNIAKALEECAGAIRGFEPERQRLLTEGAAARTALADNPYPTSKSDFDTEEEYYEALNLNTYAANTAADLETDIRTLDAKYRSCLTDASKAMDGLHDDGTAPSVIPWSLAIDTALIAAAVFIPPLGGAVAGISAAKTAYSEYQSRMKQLREEHPELSDEEMKLNSWGRTAIVAPLLVVGAAGGGAAAGLAARGAGATSRVVVDLADETGALVTSNTASRGASGMWNTPTPGAEPTEYDTINRPPLAPPKPPITVAAQSASDTQAWLNDPQRIAETKDYDRDGYTDPAYIPDTTLELEFPGNPELNDEEPNYPPPENLQLPPKIGRDAARSED